MPARFSIMTRYFVKYLDGEPMDTYRICRDDVHPQRIYGDICAILIEQGYTEVKFIEEWEAHHKIMDVVNAKPTWLEGNIEIYRRRALVNAIKYPDLHKLAKDRADQRKRVPA
jgi:hypothetical protein